MSEATNEVEVPLEDTLTELEVYQDLFQHPGWQKFISTNKDGMERIQKTAHNECVTGDEWQYQRGVISTLERLVNFQLSVEAGIEQVKLDIEERDTEPEEDEYPL